MREYTVSAQVEVVVLARSEDEAITRAHREITFGTDVQVVHWLDVETEGAP